MPLSKHEMFSKLLQQLQLPADLVNYPGFQTATIEQVDVHTKSRHYHFTIGVPKILPVAVFTPFEQHLQAAFKDIARVSLSVTAEMPAFDQALLAGYWPYVVAHAGISSSLVYELCMKQEPRLEDGRVSLTAENQPVKDFLVNQGLGKLEETYRQVGFQTLHLNADVDEEQASAQREAFKAQQAQQTAEMAKRAAEVVQKRQQAQAADPEAASGPIVVGR